MPPPESNEVSLLRLNYSNESKCKSHAKSILKENYQYCGLSLTIAKELIVNSDDYLYSDGSRATTNIVPSPLDSNNQLRTDSEISIEDEGLPFHADLVFNWTPTKGQKAPTVIKGIATKLSKTRPHLFIKIIILMKMNG